MTRVTLENSPSKVRAAKISKSPQPEKQLDLSGKSTA